MNKLYFILTVMLFGILGITPTLMAGDGPVYAVAAEGQDADARVSAQAARCPWFLLFDAQGNLVEAVANPHHRTPGGAGPMAADFLAGKGIQTVIAGEVGGKMADALKRQGIDHRTATGTAADAVRSALHQ
jgi:predicted Fe-Mo cluster-binding NifX family protein